MRVVAKLRTSSISSEADKRSRLIGELSASAGTEVRLLHTGSDVFVEAQAPDAKTAGDLAARLRALPDVESAYVKPDPQLP